MITPATVFDSDRSQQMRNFIIEARPNECYTNSVVALVDLEDCAGAYYVEGWYINLRGEYAIEHGWLELEGAVIDVTITDGEAQDYYAVSRYAPDAIWQYVNEEVTWPLWAHVEGAKEAMLAAFAQLPIDIDSCHDWARAGERVTGIKSLILE